MPAVEIKNLVKRYGTNEVVKGIDLTIEEGEVFALLGPNGAGKSTTVEMLEGHRDRTSGEISVLGFDPADG
jgi:ABC-2 type transport system ATP-binding protein